MPLGDLNNLLRGVSEFIVGFCVLFLFLASALSFAFSVVGVLWIQSILTSRHCLGQLGLL